MSFVDLAPMDVGGRLTRLRALLDGAGCDGLVVTSLVNIRYLTGFTGSAGVLLVLPDEVVLLSDGRYATQAAEQLGQVGVEARIEIGSPEEQRASGAAAGKGVGRLGLEAGHATWAQQRLFATEWFPGEELVATTGLVEGLRRTKDLGEVARIEHASAIADGALAEVLPRLADGPTEEEVAAELEYRMRLAGASGPSFETIVASGPNSAKPHARPTSRKVEPGELVVIDFGALVDGYHSDMTRTVCVGEPTDPELRKAVGVVAESQAAGVAAGRAGVDARAVDQACRAIIAEAGWADAFVHGTGHGVGLDIHEPPILGKTATATLDTAFVVTVEPGIYLP
ncbi:MAG: M24 family metallopeptidase, partial [Acidimicrobiales bacterium]